MAELSTNEIAIAVSREDDAVFRRVSGIGPKTAKLIILSLTGKVTPVLASAVAAGEQPQSADKREDVLEALVGLGWNERAAQVGLDAVLERATSAEAASVQALLRLALTELGPRNAGGSR
jgi:Holliday junction DNA helicase RuvA